MRLLFFVSDPDVQFALLNCFMMYVISYSFFLYFMSRLFCKEGNKLTIFISYLRILIQDIRNVVFTFACFI